MQPVQDLRDFVALLNLKNVQYVMIGGWAFNYYAVPRVTGDYDFFVSDSESNELKLRVALKEFGFENTLPPPEVRLLLPNKVLMLGRQPTRIDLITSISGVTFKEAWETRVFVAFGDASVNMISRDLLLKNKRASGRTKDLADAEVLEKIANNHP